MTETIQCECGVVVRGKSELHLKHNFKQHITSKKHEEQMEFLKKINRE